MGRARTTGTDNGAGTAKVHQATAVETTVDRTANKTAEVAAITTGTSGTLRRRGSSGTAACLHRRLEATERSLAPRAADTTSRMRKVRAAGTDQEPAATEASQRRRRQWRHHRSSRAGTRLKGSRLRRTSRADMAVVRQEAGTGRTGQVQAELVAMGKARAARDTERAEDRGRTIREDITVKADTAAGMAATAEADYVRQVLQHRHILYNMHRKH